MKILAVGDPHAKVEDLDDLEALMQYVEDVAKKEKVSYVWLAGDQNHHHGIVYVECMNFWKKWLEAWHEHAEWCTILGVGNHDLDGCGQPACNSMRVYDEYAEVVDQPALFVIVDSKQNSTGADFLVLPYMEDHKRLVDACQENPNVKVVLCHQTFDGSKYENGFFAKDGLDPNLIPQKHLISGHIHTPQKFGKVWYIGSPRWQTIADANVDRAIWVLEIDSNGELIGQTEYSTNKVCQRIHHIIWTPETVIDPDVFTNARVMIDFKGPAAWIKHAQETLAMNVFKIKPRIRTFPTDGPTVKVRESDGVDVAFEKFAKAYVPKGLITPGAKEKFAQLVKDRFNVQLN